MKIRLRQLDFIVKICLLLLGVCLLSFIFVKAMTPSLNSYPPLDNCFETSVHKILLCAKNPNYVPLDRISEHLIRSIIMSEDDKFFSHKGVDWIEIKNSLKKNLSQKKFARGGSTITQQLVKNAYLTQNKSLTRKAKEFFLAKALEKRYSKALILEKYLNLIELGRDLFGVQRASAFYFKKSVSDLGMLESLYLVTLLPSPKRMSQSYFNKKLSPWQINRIKALLKNFERRGQIDAEEKKFYESQLAFFPWDGSALANDDKDLELLKEEENSLAPSLKEVESATPVFRTDSHPTEEAKNNSDPENFSDTTEGFEEYRPEEPFSSEQEPEIKGHDEDSVEGF